MTLFLEARRRAGLSQRALARRADVAFRTVQLLETGAHHPRWPTLQKLAGALAVPPEGLLPAAGADGITAANAIRLSGVGGNKGWKPWFFEWVDAFRRDGLRRVEAPPATGADPRILAVTASAVEALCAERGIAPPWWCAGAPGLDEPWFPSSAESLKASALIESPAAFRKRNIFVLRDFLSRT